MSKRIFNLFSIFLNVFAICYVGRAFAGDYQFAETGNGKFTIDGELIENEDLSGLAKRDDGLGIVVTDEGATIQSLRFSPDHSGATVAASILLEGGKESELDLEGATYDGTYFYAIGSHGLSRKKAEYQKSRYGLYRFKLGVDGTPVSKPERASLAAIVSSDQVLGDYNHKPLQQRGLNIEGLAARDGKLFVGLRSPSLEGKAFVIEVAPAPLFSEGTASYRRHELLLEPGLGIRAMTATKDGFLVVAGNAGAEASKVQPRTVDHISKRGYTLYHWQPGAPPQVVGKLPYLGAKAEGILVLAESDEEIDILLVFDGIAGGRPTRLGVKK